MHVYLTFRWQLKYLRVATRFGLLAEACLALLLLPILRGLSLFRILGIQFEASVKYHTWVGTAMILFATIHGISTLFVWGVSHHIQHEVKFKSFPSVKFNLEALYYLSAKFFNIHCICTQCLCYSRAM